MEVLPVLKNEGAIVALTDTPVVLDLQHCLHGYVRIASAEDDDLLYLCGLPSITDPTVRIASTAAVEGHATVSVANVADIVRAGPTGVNRFVARALPFLWIRTVTGTVTIFVKPCGRPGEGI